MPSSGKKLRVAACQILTGQDVAKSARKVSDWISRAGQQRIRLVAFPEGCLYGYTADPKFWQSLKPATIARAEARIGRACKQQRVAAVVGSAHWQDGTWWNSLAIFDERGRLIGRYSKNFLAGEKWCPPGREIPIFNLLGVPCCFLICHDIRYPELVRLPAVRGARLCIYCSCESPLTCEYKLSAYRAMPISRAAENGIWLVMANFPADPADMAGIGQSHGNSMIVDPDGNVVAEAGHFEETLVAAQIDLQKATRWVAERIYNRQSVVRDWIHAGAALVTDHRHARRGH